MQLWQEWWVWVAIGVVLAILEVMASGYVLLGFAAGAVITGLLIWIGMLGASLSAMVLVFALASLGAWLVFRRIFGLPRDNVKVIHHDINEN
jgi:membrane protein implicated in regulation of membrane protease activity